ncbi:hypothetical protein [Pedosphaera parvula]|nr:hypothetical protein [Pedosphaera parvula]
MRSPVMALGWQVWRQNHRSIWLIVGIISFCSLANQIVPERMRLVESYRELLNTVNGMLMALSLLFIFGIFNYTETRPGKEWTGFPYRLFVLPVSTLLLVALPICLGVTSIVVAYWLWAKLVFTHAELSATWWFPLVLGTFMVLYQTVLWSLAGFRVIRIVVLGLLGPIFVFIGVLPFAAKDTTGAFWISEKFLSAILVGIAVAAFLTAWASVARQRGRKRTKGAVG